MSLTLDGPWSTRRPGRLISCGETFSGLDATLWSPPLWFRLVFSRCFPASFSSQRYSWLRGYLGMFSASFGAV